MDEDFLPLVKIELKRIAQEELLDEIIDSLDWDEELMVQVEQPLERRPADKGLFVSVLPDGDFAIRLPRQIGTTRPAEC